MSYRSLLPEQLYDADPGITNAGSPTPLVRDTRDGSVYVLDDDLRLAVDVALSTGRPLLLSGEPGSGKSSLAAYIARNLHWRYYEHVVTSRTTPRDVLWTFDSVRKLADASATRIGAEELDDFDYIEPGVLWWSIDRLSASRRGRPEDDTRPGRLAEEPNSGVNGSRSDKRAIVLLDEIDKADPDLPNGLLVPLGSTEFRVAETGTVVRPAIEHGSAVRILTILTTNGERDLPPAFLRRCVSYRLAEPTHGRLILIGRRHVAASSFLAGRVDENLLDDLAAAVMRLREQATRWGVRPPSTAEYLDAVWACATLEVSVRDEDWEAVSRLVLLKEMTPE
jgi:MoxR-like ATPase